MSGHIFQDHLTFLNGFHNHFHRLSMLFPARFPAELWNTVFQEPLTTCLEPLLQSEQHHIKFSSSFVYCHLASILLPTQPVDPDNLAWDQLFLQAPAASFDFDSIPYLLTPVEEGC